MKRRVHRSPARRRQKTAVFRRKILRKEGKKPPKYPAGAACVYPSRLPKAKGRGE